MSSEKRTIKINPDLFKVNDKNTSRKKRPTSDTKIKVRSETKPVRNKTLRNGVLRMLRENIREKQKEEYKNLINTDKNIDKKSKKSDVQDEFKTDFEKSLQYFNNLNEKEAIENSINSKQKHNMTFKREQNHGGNTDNSSQIKSFDENSISNVLPDVFNTIIPTVNNEMIPMKLNSIPKQLPPPPQYGCLRNGSLPTYRNWKQMTQRNYGGEKPMINRETQQIDEIQEKPQEKQTIISEIKKNLIEKRKKHLLKKDSNKKKDKPRLKYLKQKKTFKRSYHLGRSKIAPKIGVLISNKTVRQRISTSALHLKQTPMPEVKKFLIKKGFIKVGSIAPNDVLRQMYECAHLMCGEIENHNPENLLFNYFNDKE